MEYITMKNDEIQEEIPDKFLCCVCLDLLYKPIVLSCGHLSCFWCVHKSMHGLFKSQCPICRDPYAHFSSVCQKLHFLLKKIYPDAYKKREAEVLKDEQEMACFSPQIDEPKAIDESVCSEGSQVVSDKRKVEEERSNAANEEHKDAKILENVLPKNNEVSKQISKDDLLCLACKELLVRPVVLNCGHVYCEGCVVDMVGESEKIRCQECHICDPREFPKVCLFLEQLLVENFPEEYDLRKSGIHKTLAHYSKGNSQSHHKEGTSLSEDNNNRNDDSDVPYLVNPASYVHRGVGCDSCGVYPIIGDRYRCKDCKEMIGYDLCKDCYESPSKIPGRFNQQHTPDHRLELVAVRVIVINGDSMGLVVGPNSANTVMVVEEDDDESDEEPHDANESPSSSTE
ncbi:unnamed protein product [Thlaspi arvense]|uniref:E3 ubiquitin-protein ligase PRT1 n=1 Tax=Thlaspi arvense TaxID=13288 RepID=A0AAU9RZC5_THLAR|nr:unnamed protein product [Thlaspi arvense]